MQNLKRMSALSCGVALLSLTATLAIAQSGDAPPPPPDSSSDSSQSQQQPGRPPRMDPDRQLSMLTKRLNLATDQQTQIKPILVEQKQQMDALFEEKSLSRDERRSQMESIQKTVHSKIEAVLNEEQKEKFEKMLQNRPRRGEGGPEGGDGPPPPPPGNE